MRCGIGPPERNPGKNASTPRLVATDAPTYVTVTDAATALASRPWSVVELVESGDLRAVRYASLVLVSADDVQALGSATTSA